MGIKPELQGKVSELLKWCSDHDCDYFKVEVRMSNLIQITVHTKQDRYKYGYTLGMGYPGLNLQELEVVLHHLKDVYAVETEKHRTTIQPKLDKKSFWAFWK